MTNPGHPPTPLTDVEQGWLADGFRKLAHDGDRTGSVTLYEHERRALLKEFGRLANFATLLGEPSPAEMAGIDSHGHRVAS